MTISAPPAPTSTNSSDGHVDCALPVTIEHFQCGGGKGHAWHGKLNGGGAPLSIRTSDGNVRIDQL